MYEACLRTIVKAIFLDMSTYAAAGGHNVYRYSNDDEVCVDIPAGDIVGVEGVRKWLMKRAVVTLREGSTFVFDYGMLSVNKLVAAIQSVIPASTEAGEVVADS